MSSTAKYRAELFALTDWRLFILLFGAAISPLPARAVANENVSLVSSNNIDHLISILSSKTISARVSDSLVERYQVRSRSTDHPTKIGGDGFSESRFPITLSEFEEWPATMSGAFHFLQNPTYEKLREILKSIRARHAQEYGIIERIVVQSELWVAFDELYLDGISPVYDGRFDSKRWYRLLWEIAQTMRHIAPTLQEIRALSPPKDVLATIFGSDEITKSAEIFNVGQVLFHDKANRFRRSTHARFYDPIVDFRKLTSQQVDGLVHRQASLHVGARAMLEEYALAITDNLDLVPTTVPLILKFYWITAGPGKELHTKFDIYRINRKARDLNTDAVQRFPDDAEGWALIDLPNIPKGKNPPYRAPLRTAVCSRCHAHMPNSFNPGYEMPQVASIRLSSHGQSFSEKRNIDYKLVSAEARALWFYFSSDAPEETIRDLVDGLTPPPTIEIGIQGELCQYGVCIIVLASVATIAFYGGRMGKGDQEELFAGRH